LPRAAALARRNAVWLITLAILVVLLIFVPDQGVASLHFVGDALAGTVPFLLASVALAAYAGASGADNLIARAFTGAPALMVLSAALVGALSPFCSCGVIPLVAALLAMGVPLSAVMAFWLASPLMDPSMFAITSGIMGVEFAVAKTAAAIGIGLLGGYGALALERRGWLSDALREGVGNGGCGGAKMRAPKPVVWAFWHDDARRAKFAREATATTLFLGKWLIFAFLLESLMVAYVPGEAIARSVGGEGLGTIALAALVGVPAYLNGYAALPLVAGLIEQGMSAGAGMAFLLAGGVSSLPAAIAVWALARPPVFALYLGFALLGSMLAGLAWQTWSI
jgi:uncharacterized membrane protein YraQ (UPF0718 family)